MDREEAQPLYDEAIEKIGLEEWNWRHKAAAFDCFREEYSSHGNRYLRVWTQWSGPEGNPAIIEEILRVPPHYLDAKTDLLRQAESQLRLRCGRAVALLDLGIIDPPLIPKS